MKAILVSVDFGDLLSITLPHNRHHFSEVAVVTTPTDTLTHEIADVNGAKVFCTNSFYDNDCDFNKWKALEEGLDWFGRDGLLCIMDVDVLWAKTFPVCVWEKGKIYTPKRRMMEDLSKPIPLDSGDWKKFPLHRQQVEWAGYTQIFHADDPVLGKPPWHQINWKHAGGADSFFQQKWDKSNKLRPPFEVLHLGLAGKNWCGRVTEGIDGTKPSQAEERHRKLRSYLSGRRRGPDRYKGEKIV